MMFEDLRISKDKTPEEQMNQIKSWADSLIDSLNMLNNQVEDMRKIINEKK